MGAKDGNGVMDISELKGIGQRIRASVLELSHATKAAHVGGGLSCADILAAVFWKAMRLDPARLDDPDRDRFIMSKGHAAHAYYSALHMRGLFPKEVLDTYNREGSILMEHPGRGCAPGVETATGSLGHGLPMGLGMALAVRYLGRKSRIFVLMSDGESEEGSVWEAAMLAGRHKVSNLCVVIDFNKWQATGRSRDIMMLDPLKEKWKAFGWDAHEVDGHDMGALVEALERFPHAEKPFVIVAHTVKGKGVSFMEDDNNWHYRIPTAEEVGKAKRELGVDAGASEKEGREKDERNKVKNANRKDEKTMGAIRK